MDNIHREIKKEGNIMAKIPYKIRLETRKRRANKLGKCFYHSLNGGKPVRLPFAKPILDIIEAQRKSEPKGE